jgi:hypothetical protein
MPFSRILDNTIYPRGALADMRQAYREFCHSSVVPGATPDTAILTMNVRERHAANARQVILEAWNYLLDRACQIHFAQAS